MENRYKIDYDVRKKLVTDVKFQQGDTESAVLEFNLSRGKDKIDLTSEEITFKFLKSDKNVVTQDMANGVTILDAINGKVECVLMGETLSKSGNVTCQIYRKLGTVDETIPSFNFMVNTTIGEGTISGFYISSLESKLIEMNDLITQADTDFQTKYDGLNAEYATNLTSVTESLANVAKNETNPFTLGLDGKAIVDVRAIMQAFINLSIASGIKKITFPKGDYILSSPLNANVDDLEIDFQGSTLRWRGTANLSNSALRANGVVNVWGSLGAIANITEFVPKEELFNISLDSDAYFSNTLACKVKTDNPSLFIVGNFVNLDLSTGTNTISTFLPMAGAICEIIDITADGYIVLDYYSPYDFTGKTVTGTLTQVTPRKNVFVKNLNIIDEVVVNPTYTSDGQRDTFVSGVSFLYTVGCKVENITGKSTKFPLIINRYSHSFIGKNIKVNKPAIYGGGEGYTTQAIFCNKYNLDNIYGVRERHNVDISGGAFYIIKNAKSNRPKTNPLAMHGICEHSIVWENCIGHVGMGNGITEFPCIIDNVRFINHKGVMVCGGTDSYASNIKIIDSDIMLTNYHALTTDITNSKITLNTNANNLDLFPNKRGTTQNSYFKMFNSTFDILGGGTITVLKVQYDSFTLDKCTVNNKLNLTIAQRAVLSFVDNLNIIMSECIFNDIDRFIFATTVPKELFITIEKNIYNYLQGDKSLRTNVEIGGMTNSNIFLDFNDNKCHYTTASYLAIILLNESAGNFGTSKFYVSGRGNKFIGDLATSIKMFLTAPTTNYQLTQIMLGNIIKNYQGTTIDTTYNKLI